MPRSTPPTARLAVLFLALLGSLCTLGCHDHPDTTDGRHADAHEGAVVVEAACGQCMFDLPGQGCDLAVRVGGQAYYVDGTGLDDHGDAHAADGFCNAIRRARVGGRLEGDRYVVSSFELLPEGDTDAAH